KIKPYKEEDKGSILMIVATDLPLTERQLQRILKRTVIGLSRTGTIITNGSGEIAIGFSTANKIPHDNPKNLLVLPAVQDLEIDLSIRAVREATEGAVITTFGAAVSAPGRDGNQRAAFKDVMGALQMTL